MGEQSAYCKYDLGNQLDAEECVQDVFVKLWQNRTSINLSHSLSSYLYRAVKNRAINILESRYARKNSIIPLPPTSDLHTTGMSADAKLMEKELSDALDSAIDALPTKCATVFKLSKMQGLSNNQISLKMGIAQKTIEGHITRALKQISGHLFPEKSLHKK
ncbi:MAG: sigma-70 family RNA polymerase sigma factor [Chitinophagaceae bacterium]